MSTVEQLLELKKGKNVSFCKQQTTKKKPFVCYKGELLNETVCLPQLWMISSTVCSFSSFNVLFFPEKNQQKMFTKTRANKMYRKWLIVIGKRSKTLSDGASSILTPCMYLSCRWTADGFHSADHSIDQRNASQHSPQHKKNHRVQPLTILCRLLHQEQKRQKVQIRLQTTICGDFICLVTSTLTAYLALTQP